MGRCAQGLWLQWLFSIGDKVRVNIMRSGVVRLSDRAVRSLLWTGVLVLGVKQDVGDLWHSLGYATLKRSADAGAGQR